MQYDLCIGLLSDQVVIQPKAPIRQEASVIHQITLRLNKLYSSLIYFICYFHPAIIPLFLTLTPLYFVTTDLWFNK